MEHGLQPTATSKGLAGSLAKFDHSLVKIVIEQNLLKHGIIIPRMQEIVNSCSELRERERLFPRPILEKIKRGRGEFHIDRLHEPEFMILLGMGLDPPECGQRVLCPQPVTFQLKESDGILDLAEHADWLAGLVVGLVTILQPGDL
jgi:hypothetical protein